MAKKPSYVEPLGYFPKEIREKYFGKDASGSSKKKSGKKVVRKSTKSK